MTTLPTLQAAIEAEAEVELRNKYRISLNCLNVGIIFNLKPDNEEDARFPVYGPNLLEQLIEILVQDQLRFLIQEKIDALLSRNMLSAGLTMIDEEGPVTRGRRK